MIEIDYQPYFARAFVVYERELNERGYADPFEIWMQHTHHAKEGYWSTNPSLHGLLCWKFATEEDATLFVLRFS